MHYEASTHNQIIYSTLTLRTESTRSDEKRLEVHMQRRVSRMDWSKRELNITQPGSKVTESSPYKCNAVQLSRYDAK